MTEKEFFEKADEVYVDSFKHTTGISDWFHSNNLLLKLSDDNSLNRRVFSKEEWKLINEKLYSKPVFKEENYRTEIEDSKEEPSDRVKFTMFSFPIIPMVCSGVDLEDVCNIAIKNATDFENLVFKGTEHNDYVVEGMLTHTGRNTLIHKNLRQAIPAAIELLEKYNYYGPYSLFLGEGLSEDYESSLHYWHGDIIKSVNLVPTLNQNQFVLIQPDRSVLDLTIVKDFSLHAIVDTNEGFNPVDIVGLGLMVPRIKDGRGIVHGIV